MRGSYVVILVVVFVLPVILIASIGMTPAFGQIQISIVVTTDKASYSAGETILVTGEVLNLYGVPVTIIVKSPNGNWVSVNQVNVGTDKKFSTGITAGGTMKTAGTYTIEVTYGNVNRMATTSFFFDGSTTQTPTLTPTTTPTPTSSDSFPMEYVIVGIVIVAVVAGIAVALSKRKKTTVAKSIPSSKPQKSDATQFWVCPHCGGDTEDRNGKQYCPPCKIYL